MSLSLVTGASGFLGRYLVDALVSREDRVRALVRTSSHISHLPLSKVETATGDLSDVQSLEKSLDGVDVVYHCAAYVSDWGSKEDYESANVQGVKNLLEALSRSGVRRLVHVSTTDVYGHPDAPLDESAPYRRRGILYGDTKITAEELVWEYSQRHQLPTTVVRPASIYGPHSASLVKEIADLLLAGEMVLVGAGDRRAGLAYVSNVVDLMLAAADNDKSVGEAYNATDGSEVAWKQYVSDLAKILDVPPPRWRIPYRIAYATGWMMEKAHGLSRRNERPLLTRMAVELLGTDQGFSVAKAARDLGYQPKVRYEEGMERVAAWLASEYGLPDRQTP